MIEKIQSNTEAFKIKVFYYKRARDAMYDAVSQLVEKGYKDIYISGYIGWSPREGSGIFDSLNSITELTRHYYRMTKELSVDVEDLQGILNNHSVLLVVNYFGFRDHALAEMIKLAKSRDCVVIEDNVHGLFTFFCNGPVGSDLTFFSLHKVLPFSKGGALLVENFNLEITAVANIHEPVLFNPFEYNLNEIAKVRINNFRKLMGLIKGKEKYFVPLKSSKDLEINVPQTFLIIINRGDRSKIYEIMNNAGYGVVSLYHTMIDELQDTGHEEACWFSQKVMNLLEHQDVNPLEYQGMIDSLIIACEETERGII